MSDTIVGNSLLSRAGVSSSAYTPLQSQVDGLVGGFAAQATDWRSLAAITAGGMAYRTARVGVMGLGSGSALRAASVGLGLTAEVSTFELVHRGMTPHHGENPNLWRWSGAGGLAQGFFQSFITFGALKGAGHLARAENVILQHLAQDTAMVAGHQMSGVLGIAPRPTGTLAEQFLHAEATNLQLGAGMALAHRMAPGVLGLERGMDLSLRFTDGSTRSPHPGEDTSPLQPAYSLAAGEGFAGVRAPAERDPKRDGLVFSVAHDGIPKPGEFPSSLPSSAPPRPYRLRIQNFGSLVEALRENPKQSIILAEREIEGRWVSLEVKLDSIFSDGKMGDFLEVSFLEGDRSGFGTLHYKAGESVGAHKIVTDTKLPTRLPPGAGTMILHWLASSAAAEGIGFNLYRVENPRIFRILERENLLDPQESWTEMHSFNGPILKNGQVKRPLFDREHVQLIAEQRMEDHVGMAIIYQVAVNVIGRPHPALLHRKNRPVSGIFPMATVLGAVERSMAASNGLSHPFRIILGGWDRLAESAERRETLIAVREELPLKVIHYHEPLRPVTGSFTKGPMREWILNLHEPGGRGTATVFVEPKAIGLYAIDTIHPELNKGPAMNPGAGTIFMDWLATEAAVHGMGFNVFQIENPHVFHMLQRNGLIDPATAVVEACWHTNSFEREFSVEGIFPFLNFDPSRGKHPHFWNVRARPHPGLIPPGLNRPSTGGERIE